MIAFILAIIGYPDDALIINKEISGHGRHAALDDQWNITFHKHCVQQTGHAQKHSLQDANDGVPDTVELVITVVCICQHREGCLMLACMALQIIQGGIEYRYNPKIRTA